MASDNEDDDLDALREAALATLKQKVQPIENVFSGSNFARSQDTAAWSDVPASIDFPAFSDPIPEQNHFPSPFGEPADQPPLPQHLFRPASNFHWNPSHQNRLPPFQRMRHPRFPHRTFGGLMHDRVNRRIRPRGFFPPQTGRGGPPPGNHPHHLTNTPLSSQAPAMGANLIVIQPHIHPGGDVVHSSASQTANPANKSPAVNNLRNSQPKPENVHSSSKLILPQDKYHSSGNLTFTPGPDKEPVPKTKSKDKFSRYDKSDSEEDDDLSEVDDIANEIDKVLQDDFLDEEITVQEAEEPETTDNKSETVAEEEKKEGTEESPSSSPVAPETQEIDNDAANDPKTPGDAVSDISDSESLDLDALAGGEPVIGDLEDLDSLVDKEPDNVMDVIDSKGVIDRNCRKGSTDSNDNDRNIESRDNCVDSSKKDSDVRESSRENRTLSKRKSTLQRPSPLSPNNYGNSSPSRYKNPISPPRNYDSYSNRAYPSPRRSRSPLYSRHPTYRSTSPRSAFRPRSRSPYRHKSPIRRSSISPRRRVGSPSNRRYESSPRRYPVDTMRRRSLSPIRRARSPPSRDNYRPSREEGNRVRDGPRQEHRYRDSDRSHRDRDRSRQVERDRSENQKELDSKAKDTDNKISPASQRISPLMEKNNISQEKEKVSIDLEKLTPEERVKIEARRKKFDSSGEVNVTEASKKISLKDIKKREKKAKKKEDEEKAEKVEVENLKMEESLPDVVNKKSSSKAGISLKKLRKKQESKKKKDDVEEQESLKVAGLADLEDESEDDSDEGRSWRKESSRASGPGIRFGVSRTMVNKAPLVSLDSIGREGGRRHQDLNRRQHSRHHERRSCTERERSTVSKSQRIQSNRWSSDEDTDNGGIQASRLNSSVVTSKPFEADVPPEKLRIQVQIASKDSKKKSKSVPDFSNVYSVHAKRHRGADITSSYSEEKDGVEKEVVPVKKMKKKKEKKKKHSKDESPKRSNFVLMDEFETLDSPSKSPAKPSVLERLGKKVSLDLLEKKDKKKKKSKKNRDIDEDTDDLDLHILKMKAKNEEILRRQREIQLDKERYG